MYRDDAPVDSIGFDLIQLMLKVLISFYPFGCFAFLVASSLGFLGLQPLPQLCPKQQLIEFVGLVQEKASPRPLVYSKDFHDMQHSVGTREM